ncbi:SEP-domain-containing protein [Trametes cingulata]|nr:SEP-domain-containing protein [Trametes cingulata]
MSDENDSTRRSRNPFALPSNTGPRIGRVGAWGSSGSTPSSRTSSTGGGRRIATLGDIASSGGPSVGGGHAGHGHAHTDDDDDEEDERPGADQGENWYAGGERSGISVQNPDRPAAVPGGNLVRDLLRRAAEAGPPAPQPGAAPQRSRAFFGGGYMLGSDEVDSQFVPDPDAPQPEEETAIRHLTFWRDGFTVEDGELMRYDDPANEQILAEINSGRAPPQILNVAPGQPVELRVVKRLSEDYVPSPKARQAKVFSGQGHRLGSPVPGELTPGASSSGSGSGMPGGFPSGSASAGGSSLPAQRTADSISTRFEVDQTKPTTSVQIRLADGTRMVARMNLTHTVGDIRNFINASRPENNARPYVIMTTFPNRELQDETQTIEAAGLANSVVVQRWS